MVAPVTSNPPKLSSAKITLGHSRIAAARSDVTSAATGRTPLTASAMASPTVQLAQLTCRMVLSFALRLRTLILAPTYWI